jgi:hypothetical protein
MKWWVAVLAGAGAVACRGQDGGSGRIEVAWTGDDTGRFEVPARAYWCAGDSVLELIGESGDSGIAVALFPTDTVRAGDYPVGQPASNPIRPGARVALRWFGETVIAGFYSQSGTVAVEGGSELGGRVAASLIGVHDSRNLNLTGTFRGVPVLGGVPEVCGAGPAVSADTSVQ